MSDTELICKFLRREYQDDDPVIYLYVCGNVRSPKTAIQKALDVAKLVFFPAMTEYVIQKGVIKFLDEKKELYKRGLISVKPLY